MAFTRRAISGYGLTNEQLEKVMALHAASLAGYVPKSEVREQINLALAGALENAQVTYVKDSDEYKKLQREFDSYKKKVEILTELKNYGVKEKFVNTVYSMLQEGKNVAEQIEVVREKYEEFFDLNSENPAPVQKSGEKMPISKVFITIEYV